MAKERINPQFDIQRVVQPVASPVDVYFRPNMVQPDTSRQLQIVRALQDLNPQLQRLTSDAMALMIDRESQAGQMEAMTLPEEALRRKATEWIEKSGGVAPWRYQAALETAGTRLVRDKYQSKLYAQLDSLSEPFNADGTVKNPSELTAAMDAAYADVGVPNGSFFMQKGATQAKAQIDELVSQKVSAMRLEKVKAKAGTDLMDNIFAELNVTPGEDLPERMNGQIKTLLDEYYAQGYGSGDDVLVKAFDARIDVELSRKNFDQARYLVSYLAENGVAGRKIGGAYNKQLQDKLESIDKAEEADDERDYARRERADSRVMTEAGRITFTLLQDMKMSNAGLLNMPLNKAREVVERDIMPKLTGATDEQKARLVGAITDSVMQIQNQVNAPTPGDPRLARQLAKLAISDPAAAEEQATQARIAGSLDERGYQQILAAVDSTKSYPPEISQLISDSSKSVSGLSWTSMDPQTIDPAMRGWFAEVGNQGSDELEDLVRAEVDGPKFRELMANDPRAAQSRLRAFIREETKKIRADLQSRYTKELATADITASSGALVSGLATETKVGTAAIAQSLGVTDETTDSGIISLMISETLNAELRQYASTLSGVPDVNTRRNMVAAQLPKIVQDLRNRIKANPKKFFGTSTANAIGATAAQSVATLGRPSPAAPAEVRLRPGQVVGEAVSPDTWTIFSRAAMSGREADVGRSAKRVAELNIEASANPSSFQITDFNSAKSRLNSDAIEAIRELRGGMTTQEYLSSSAPELRNSIAVLNDLRASGADLTTPAFEIRQDGIYAIDLANPRSGQKVRNDRVTNKYWAYKSLVGYSPDEISKGMTKEGLTISSPFMDPSSFLFFDSKEAFEKADREYQESGGESGYIADTVLPTLNKAQYTTSYDDFIRAQALLIRLRLPIQ